jgi:hypothetical protein
MVIALGARGSEDGEGAKGSLFKGLTPKPMGPRLAIRDRCFGLEVATDSPHAEMRPLDAPEAVNRNGDVVAVLNTPPFATPESTQSSDSSPGLATDSPAAEMRPLDAPKRVKMLRWRFLNPAAKQS